MRSISQVSCSLNLGMIYGLNYSYSPDSGTKIRVYFVNREGRYTKPSMLPLRKAHISIGGTSFSMYPVECEIEYESGRRIIWVEFEDEFLFLEHYYIALPGRGCGQNIFTLGEPVDNRSITQKMADSLDPVATKIEQLTQFPDYAYTFDQFLSVLRTRFSVQISANFDSTYKRDFEGSFLNVLTDWCDLYNLSFFFQNGIIKIFDPTTLTITLPAQTSEMLSYTDGESIRDTYGKTVSNWFQQDGDQYSLSQASGGDKNASPTAQAANGPLYVRSDTLYPAGYEFNLYQPPMDANQVAAAQYGPQFWFLYNYYYGLTSTNCGWSPVAPPSTLNSVQSVAALGGKIAVVNTDEQVGKYEAFYEYGKNIAGRYYLSNRKDTLAIEKNFQWFDESEGQIFNFADVDDKAMTLDFLTPVGAGNNSISETVINEYFPGVNYVGNRMVYKDTAPLPSGAFVLDGGLQAMVASAYQAVYNVKGGESFDFNTELAPLYTGNNTYVAYVPWASVPQELVEKFQEIPTEAKTYLSPRFASVPIKGVSSQDYSSVKAAQEEPEEVNIVSNNSGPNIVSNTSVIKTAKEGTYTIYYDKYSQCASASTPDSYYSFRFAPQQISTDSQFGITFNKQAGNTYQLNRNYAVIDSLVNNPLLSTLAQPRTFPTKRVTFTKNYFDTVPQDFLSNGLVGMSVSISDNGVQASYTYSNEVLRLPDRTSEFANLQQAVKNSWIRTYRPNKTILS